MTIIPPLQYFQMYFRSCFLHMRCFWAFQSYTQILEGPENHSRGTILSYFHPTLARNKSWTILNDHYTPSTVLLNVFQITFGVYEVFPTLPKPYRGFGRAWKSFARSYFHQKRELEILNYHYTTSIEYFQMYFRSLLLTMRCFSASQIYTEVLDGPENHP